MRVLLVNYEYPPVGGGAANATWEIARAMVHLRHEPVVLTARYDARTPDAANPGIKVIQVPAVRRRADRCSIFEMATLVVSAGVRIRRLLRREDIDGMIAFFSIPCGPIAWWGWRESRIPYVVALRGGDVPGNEPSLGLLHRGLRPLRHAVLRNAQAIVANSAGLKAAAEAVDPFPVKVIPNGIDTNFWIPPDTRPSPSPFRFLFVGRLQAQKNVAWLLERLAEVKAPDAARSWTLDIVGDGRLRGELQHLATRLGLVEQVHWYGWLPRNNLRNLYQQTHALINPSSYEGMPNVVLEAMSCGLPVLASDVPGNATLVETAATGELFAIGDASGFLSVVRSWLQQPERAAELGAAGQRQAVTKYSWIQTAEAYLRCLVVRSNSAG